MEVPGPPKGPVYGGKGPLVLGLTWPAAGIASCLILARVYQWCRINKQGGWALTWALVSCILCNLVQILATVAVSYGIGVHEADLLATGNLEALLLWSWMTIGIFQLTIASGKVAAVSFLLAVQGPTFKKGRYFLHFLAISNILISIPLTVFAFTQCSPSQKLWNPSIPGVCHTRALYKFVFVDGCYTGATDLMLSIYPIGLLWSLQMDIRLKWIYRFLLGLVGFTCVCSCFRTYAAYLFHTTPLDTSYVLADLFIWGGIEMYVTLITTSIPALWPTVRKFCPLRVENLKRLSGQPNAQHNPGSGSDSSAHCHRDNPPSVPSKSKPRSGLNISSLSSLFNAADAWKLTPRGIRSQSASSPTAPTPTSTSTCPRGNPILGSHSTSNYELTIQPHTQAHAHKAHISHSIAPGQEQDLEALGPDLITMRQDVIVGRESIESWDFNDYDGVTGVVPIYCEAEGRPSQETAEVSWRSIISNANPYYQQGGPQTPSRRLHEQELSVRRHHQRPTDVRSGKKPAQAAFPTPPPPTKTARIRRDAAPSRSVRSEPRSDTSRGSESDYSETHPSGGARREAARPSIPRTRTENAEAGFGDLGTLPSRVRFV
ncbi:MAG: hypothetical protein M1828_003549 [Chrysothrix sp. TS-e1954]|nr:MAG: hypothetical protein M1828_003549 [Chrysothrix sp. TS-e1954]